MRSDKIIDGGRVSVAAEAAVNLSIGRGAEAELGDYTVGVCFLCCTSDVIFLVMKGKVRWCLLMTP